MQTREQQLAKLKTTFVESSNIRLDSPLVTELVREFDIMKQPPQELPLIELATLLPPELITIILLCLGEYYFMPIRLSSENLCHTAKDQKDERKNCIDVEKVANLRNAVELALLKYSDEQFISCSEKKLERNTNLRTMGDHTNIYALYSRVTKGENTMINIHAYFILSLQGRQTQQAAVVLSNPINYKYKPKKNEKGEYETSLGRLEYTITCEPYTFAEAIYICSQQMHVHIDFIDNTPLLPLGVPYQYVMGDNQRNKTVVTQELLDCHRLFAHQTTVNPPHQLFPKLPKLTSTVFHKRFMQSVGLLLNSKPDKTSCCLTPNTEDQKPISNQQKK